MAGKVRKFPLALADVISSTALLVSVVSLYFSYRNQVGKIDIEYVSSGIFPECDKFDLQLGRDKRYNSYNVFSILARFNNITGKPVTITRLNAEMNVSGFVNYYLGDGALSYSSKIFYLKGGENVLINGGYDFANTNKFPKSGLHMPADSRKFLSGMGESESIYISPGESRVVAVLVAIPDAVKFDSADFKVEVNTSDGATFASSFDDFFASNEGSCADKGQSSIAPNR